MDIKKTIWFLIGVVFISFGVGVFSLRYNDGFSFNNLNNISSISISSNNPKINIDNGKINIKDKDSHVSIGWDGINVKDGNDHVSIGWKGINVKDENDHVSIDWRGLKIFNRKNLMFGNKDLEYFNINEKTTETIEGINNISIISSFVDLKITSEERDDIRIHYYGNIKSNVKPELKVTKEANTLKIRFNTNKTNINVSTRDIVAEIFVPKDFQGDYDIQTSSGDMILRDLTGTSFYLSSSSGDMEIRNIVGKTINSTTSSGDMDLINISGDITLSSSSGDINMDIGKDTGNIRTTTSSGDTEFNFTVIPDYSITGNTFSGRLKYNGPMNISQNKDKSFDFILGDGSKNIQFSTSSGDIYINHR